MKKVIPLCLFMMLLCSCTGDNFEGLDFLDEQADVTENQDENTDDSNKDSDQDGVSDKDEKTDGTDPSKPDTDGDGMSDGDEKKNGTDPLKTDTDDDGVNDGDEDKDGTDPLKPDTDEDTVTDGEEKKNGTDPLKPDTDDDGVNDGDENKDGTDPLVADSDGDGVSDGDEKKDTTDALDNCSLIIASQTLAPENKWKEMDCDSDGVNNQDELDNGTDPLVDEPDNPDPHPLVGTWILKSATIDNGTATTVFNDSTYSLTYTATSENENAQAIFTENPNKIVSTGNYQMVINFTFLGKDYSENITSNAPFSSGEWEIVDNKLKLASNDTVDGNYEIVEQNETTLILKAEVDRVIQAGGADLDTKGTLIITLGKAE